MKSTIMFSVQDYKVVFYNAVCSVICECWHVTHMWNASEWPHHFTKDKSGLIKLALLRHFLLKCLYESRRVSGHVFVW